MVLEITTPSNATITFGHHRISTISYINHHRKKGFVPVAPRKHIPKDPHDILISWQEEPLRRLLTLDHVVLGPAHNKLEWKTSVAQAILRWIEYM